jgi:hypothetical protein
MKRASLVESGCPGGSGRDLRQEPGTERTDGQAGRAALLRDLLGDLPRISCQSPEVRGAAKGCTRRVEPA